MKSCSCNADGCYTVVIGERTVELSLLEVAGAFGYSDVSRSTKDHIKESFGTMALLQEIGHIFELGSLETFHKIRVCFVQALGKGINYLKRNITSIFVLQRRRFCSGR